MWNVLNNLGSMVIEDGGVRVELNPGLPWQKLHLTRRRIFASNLNLNLRKTLVRCYVCSMALLWIWNCSSSGRHCFVCLHLPYVFVYSDYFVNRFTWVKYKWWTDTSLCQLVICKHSCGNSSLYFQTTFLSHSIEHFFSK